MTEQRAYGKARQRVLAIREREEKQRISPGTKAPA